MARFLLIALAVLVAAGGLIYLLRAPILRAMALPLVEDDGAQKADCIVVLGGDLFGYRTTKGGDLVRQGYAPYVLVDGPRSLIGPESVQMIAFAVSSGYSATLFRSLPLPPSIDSTSEESDYVANKILRPQGIHKILLVTSNYHTRRAARIMRRTAPWLQVIVVPAFDPYFSVDGWWKSRAGKKTFLYEWLKTISEWRGD